MSYVFFVSFSLEWLDPYSNDTKQALANDEVFLPKPIESIEDLRRAEKLVAHRHLEGKAGKATILFFQYLREEFGEEAEMEIEAGEVAIMPLFDQSRLVDIEG